MPIHRFLDPVFALSIGSAAAYIRINREEKEQGHTTEQSMESLKRRWKLLTAKEQVAPGESPERLSKKTDRDDV